ncbi:hypothetical protein V6N11_043349 [Hibiscus sabdariffa]|uniref:Uncharacterized protein n=1 Tax=Hibiscus sabdariffa TaxID=183260 RepID=A0ABR2AAL2_9ROSI
MTEAIKFREVVSSNLESTEIEEKAVSVGSVVGSAFSGGATSSGFEAFIEVSKEFRQESHEGMGRPEGIAKAVVVQVEVYGRRRVSMKEEIEVFAALFLLFGKRIDSAGILKPKLIWCYDFSNGNLVILIGSVWVRLF